MVRLYYFRKKRAAPNKKANGVFGCEEIFVGCINCKGVKYVVLLTRVEQRTHVICYLKGSTDRISSGLVGNILSNFTYVDSWQLLIGCSNLFSHMKSKFIRGLQLNIMQCMHGMDGFYMLQLYFIS